MGKKNFEDLYKKIELEFKGELKGKISAFSPSFEPQKSYSGAIIYAIDGNYTWKNNEKCRAKNQNGRSFYVIIDSTDDKPYSYFNHIFRKGKVHRPLLKDFLGIEMNYEESLGRICAGGFSYCGEKKELRFKSVYLNEEKQMGCESDETEYLSNLEKSLVEYCFEQYKSNGPDHVFAIPSLIYLNMPWFGKYLMNFF